jgi:hypothetical protein
MHANKDAATVPDIATMINEADMGTLKTADGEPVPMPAGSPPDEPKPIQVRNERVAVAFRAEHEGMGQLFDLICRANYPWIVDFYCLWTPSGRLDQPETITTCAQIEVTCAIPTTMTGEQVANELRAAVKMAEAAMLERLQAEAAKQQPVDTAA